MKCCTLPTIGLILFFCFPQYIYSQPISELGASIASFNGPQMMVSKRESDGSLSSPKVYTMKAVRWDGASKDTKRSSTDPLNKENIRREYLKWYKKDIPMMRKMNTNTVLLPFDLGFESEFEALKILDEFYCNDIMVVMTVDDGINDTSRIKQAVSYFKDHPAILMWMIGHQWNKDLYHRKAKSILEAAEWTETAAQLIKSIDTQHPVATGYRDIYFT